MTSLSTTLARFNNTNTSGNRGLKYEALNCMTILFRSYKDDLKDFELSYQIKEAGKFDDILYKQQNHLSILAIQLKHKENPSAISDYNIFPCLKIKDNLKLLMYVDSYIVCKQNFINNGCNMQKAILFTNDYFELTPDNKLILNLPDPIVDRKKYKYYNDLYAGVTSIQLQEISNVDGKNILNFTTVASTAKFYQFSKDVIPILKRQVLNHTDVDLEDALEHIVYAVGQPNDDMLEDLIKNELKTSFHVHNDDLYNKFYTEMENWCNKKTGFFPKVITWNEVDNFFQTNADNRSFNVKPPKDYFTGRTAELAEIIKILTDTHICIITGLGGIGKSQLVKKYINEHKDQDFNGRVCWISAESNISVEDSFRRFAQKLRIDNIERWNIDDIIDEILEHYKFLDVLLVFDNLDRVCNDFDTCLVRQFYVKASTSIFRPYFIITSRLKDCIPNVPSHSHISLSSMKLQESIELIRAELEKEHYSPDYQQMEQLAKTLQHFPLALTQAIAYIREKLRNRVPYAISNYLEQYELKKKELLEFKLPTYLSDQEKTTFITWNVTLTEIQHTPNYGENAIKIIQIMSYLYADEIDRKLFLKQNETETTNAALNLLERYSMITNIEDDIYQIHRLVQTVIRLSTTETNVRCVEWPQNERDLLIKTTEMVVPEIFYWYKKRQRSSMTAVDYPEISAKYFASLENCNLQQGLHLDALYDRIKDYASLLIEYKELFKDIRLSTIIKPALKDDLKTVLKLIQSDKKVLFWLLRGYSHALVQRRCMKILKHIIEKRLVKINNRYPDGTLLYSAVCLKDIEFVNYLLEKGAEPSPLEYGEVSVSISLHNHEVFSLLMAKTRLDQLFSEKQCFLQYNDQSSRFIETFNTSGWDINVRSIDGITLLHLAVFFDCRDFVFKLLNFSANINVQDDNGETPLYYAMKHRKTGMAKILLENEPDLSLRTNNGDTFLQLAVRQKFLKSCHSLLSNGADILQLRNYSDEELARASIDGDVNKVKQVIGSRPGIGSYKYDDEISFFAIVNDRNKIIEYLIERNVLSDKVFAWAPKKIAIEFESLKTLKVLLRDIDSDGLKDELFDYLESDDFANLNVFGTVLNLFIEKRGDINTTNNNGSTLICLATNDSSENLKKLAIVELLLSNGGDVNIRDNHDRIPLEYLCLEEEFRNLTNESPLFNQYQRIHGQIMNETNLENIGGCLFKYFDNYSHNRIAFRNLFDHYHTRNGLINVTNDKNQTFLHLCVKNFQTSTADDDFAFIKHLVDECNIDVDAVDNTGHTALYYAVHIFNTDEMFKYLLEKSLTIDERILKLAIRLNQLPVIQALFSIRLDHNYRFLDGKSPLQEAIELKQEDIAAFLRSIQ